MSVSVSVYLYVYVCVWCLLVGKLEEGKSLRNQRESQRIRVPIGESSELKSLKDERRKGRKERGNVARFLRKTD